MFLWNCICRLWDVHCGRVIAFDWFIDQPAPHIDFVIPARSSQRFDHHDKRVLVGDSPGCCRAVSELSAP